ncbi:hypothetical protein [Actinokineospora sp. UTMC 2448]|nr:hypothetical protein [Actinokineospora sp. UTMC 2448]UVS80127.1 hypothetical protein Actkin_03877 [Actinokineospora sp. UTMC 2448]
MRVRQVIAALAVAAASILGVLAVSGAAAASDDPGMTHNVTPDMTHN